VKSKITDLPTPKRLDYKLSKSEHVLSYDLDNKYPQRIEDIINDSKTAVNCIRIRSNFIMGGGFKDENFYKAKVNRDGLTCDKLLRLCSKDIAKYESLALHLNFNALGQIVEVNHIPWNHVRFSQSEDEKYKNKVAIYDDWGLVKKPKVALKDIQFIDYYSSDIEVMLNQINDLSTTDKDGEIIDDGWSVYKGQVYIYTPNPKNYPLFYGDVALEYMQTEGEMKRFNFKSVKNNFLSSHFIIVGKKETDKETTDLTNNLAQFQGGDGTARLMLIEKENADDIFEVQKVDIQNYDGIYKYTDEQSKTSIRESFNIPEMLFIADQNALDSSSAILEAVNLYNGNTADERLIIEEVFSEIFGRWHYDINVTNDYSVIPFKYPKSSTEIKPEYFPYYTTNEIREGNGDAPIIEQGANDKLLAEKLGVGGTQSLTSILTDLTLTDEQKFGALKVLFSLTDEQVTQMLGVAPLNSNIQ
jgi:hypothetical protein